MLKHALTYSSDLIIRDPGILSSLCVFFDNIYLPHLPTEHAGLFLRVTEAGSDPDVDLCDLPSAGEYHHEWDKSHELLFANSVLARLPPVARDVEIDDQALRTIINELQPNVSGFSRRLYLLTRVVHHLRPDQLAPHVIDSGTEIPTRDGYKWLMAHEAFSYLIPSLTDLSAEQILQVRDTVADTREGFAMHLQQLSREVERRVSAGDPVETIKRHARSVIDTDLVPDFVEFHRQLSANRAGFLGKLLDMAAKSIKLLVPATRPDFAASGFTTLSAIMAATADERKARNTNVAQAFQFLSIAKSEVEAATEKAR
ncbi:hypothetical protein [Thalassoglobus polymorphus]|uniref:Uncharacterized protein n=1 Tax=Thalassoglobus polymorphus TaxID=2527994 RepID=A0A517QUR9_9PLAN|nr:hypothetical protein [Thalassoglobus polymorphus]QDT35378.1 hypothetical protein Mal48_46550 [Thalassoglobus polymorphus]